MTVLRHFKQQTATCVISLDNNWIASYVRKKELSFKRKVGRHLSTESSMGIRNLLMMKRRRFIVTVYFSFSIINSNLLEPQDFHDVLVHLKFSINWKFRWPSGLFFLVFCRLLLNIQFCFNSDKFFFGPTLFISSLIWFHILHYISSWLKATDVFFAYINNYVSFCCYCYYHCCSHPRIFEVEHSEHFWINGLPFNFEPSFFEMIVMCNCYNSFQRWFPETTNY